MIKKIFAILIFPALLFFSGCGSLPPLAHLNTIASSANLRVIYFDVGQGDSALIITPKGKTILIDGGPDDKVLSRLGEALPVGQKKIDTMILTHPHADHLDGLVSVLKRYEVGEVYYTGVIHTTSSFLEWLKLIKEKKIPMKIINKIEDVAIDSATLHFLYPNRNLSFSTSTASGGDWRGQESKNQKTNSNLNNTSIVFKLVYGRTSFLFMGDAEIPVEKELLMVGVDLKADILKVGHHGSHSSTSEEFLSAVGPEYAVISAGKNNDFGHPHLRTLRRLERHNVKIFRTDEDGSVEFASNGEKIIKK